MANGKEIKNRIRSVKSTKKITKAMELVAASKMKRGVSSTLASRPYAKYSWGILNSISENVEKVTHPLLVGHEKESHQKSVRENILLILITSNRGLCGAYNAQIIKKVLTLLKSTYSAQSAQELPLRIDIVAIGKKGDAMMRKIGQNVVASFFELPDNVSLADIIPVSTLMINEYNLSHYDKVLVAYTDFVSAMLQRPNIRQIIPISSFVKVEPLQSKGSTFTKKHDYLFEGDQNALIGSLAEKIIRMQVYQMFLESNASEQSSRMLAMKNATEAAGEMVDNLTLMFNKARQSSITREILEISAGMASMS